jgi:hypothetical protein
MGLAALSYFGWFSALRLHVSHFEGPSQHLAPAVNAVYVWCVYDVEVLIAVYVWCEFRACWSVCMKS